jgi:hypothetical protein
MLFTRHLRANAHVFTSSLRGATYVRAVETKATSVTHRGDSSACSPSGPYSRMSRWRWLLFAAMARFEVAEEVYYRVPTTNTSPAGLFSWVPSSLGRRIRR